MTFKSREANRNGDFGIAASQTSELSESSEVSHVERLGVDDAVDADGDV